MTLSGVTSARWAACEGVIQPVSLKLISRHVRNLRPKRRYSQGCGSRRSCSLAGRHNRPLSSSLVVIARVSTNLNYDSDLAAPPSVCEVFSSKK